MATKNIFYPGVRTYSVLELQMICYYWFWCSPQEYPWHSVWWKVEWSIAIGWIDDSLKDTLFSFNYREPSYWLENFLMSVSKNVCLERACHVPGRWMMWVSDDETCRWLMWMNKAGVYFIWGSILMGWILHTRFWSIAQIKYQYYMYGAKYENLGLVPGVHTWNMKNGILCHMIPGRYTMSYDRVDRVNPRLFTAVDNIKILILPVHPLYIFKMMY